MTHILPPVKWPWQIDDALFAAFSSLPRSLRWLTDDIVSWRDRDMELHVLAFTGLARRTLRRRRKNRSHWPMTNDWA